MAVLMPRCSACVLCGDPIPGKGRIDRIYCSASCRTLAWRARSGDRFRGRRKSLPPQPGSYVARRALPLLAVRMRAELEAAKRRVAELEAGSSEESSAGLAMAVGGAAGGAAGLLLALKWLLPRKQQAMVAQIQAALAEERAQQQVAQATEREEAARRQEAQEQQVIQLRQALVASAQREHQATNAIPILGKSLDDLRKELGKADQRYADTQREIDELRWELSETKAESQRHKDRWHEQSKKCEELRSQVAQLDEERRLRNLYMSRNVELQRRLNEVTAEANQAARYAQELRASSEANAATAAMLLRELNAPQPKPSERLAKMQARAEKAEQALATLRTESEQKAREAREQIEQLSKSLAKVQQSEPEEERKTSDSKGAKRKKKSRKGRGRLPKHQPEAQTESLGAGWAAVAGVGLVGAAALAKGRRRIEGSAGGKLLPPKRS